MVFVTPVVHLKAIEPIASETFIKSMVSSTKVVVSFMMFQVS